jgi:outer membrane cobalamin receptor
LIRNLDLEGRITLTAFGVIQKNAIALSGKTYLDTALNITRELYVNRDQNQAGLEFELVSPQLFSFIHPFLNFTLMKSMKDENGKMVTDKENPLFISAAGLYMDKSSFDLNILAKYVSRFENDRFAAPADGSQPLGDYLTIDVSAGYTTKWNVPVRFYLRSKNITDEKYSTVIGYPDFGRMVFGGVQIKF